MMRMPAALAMLLVVPAATTFAQEMSVPVLVEQANRAYAAGDYESALESYKAAEVSLPESPELAYNLGVSHYKMKDYDAAREAFNRALLTRDLGLEAKAKFNLGNVAYASALEKQTDLQEAIDLAKTAIGHYRDALELHPDDSDARANIETAQLLIKDLLDKLKKQQEEQQQQQQQNQQQPEQQQQQGNPAQQQEPQDGEPQDQQQPQDGQKQDQQQEQDEVPPGAGSNQRQPPQQPPPSDEMSDVEAERMLQAVRDKEKLRREGQARRARVRSVRVPKDW